MVDSDGMKIHAGARDNARWFEERAGYQKQGETGRLFHARWRLLWWAAFAGALRTPAQQPAPPTVSAPSGEQRHPEDNSLPDQIPTIRATVELVNVPVTAMTKRGQRVIDLNMDEVKIFEDGVEQKITHFERETRTPLRIGLIIDTSNSARTPNIVRKGCGPAVCRYRPDRRHEETRHSLKPSTLPVPSSRTLPAIRIC